MNAEMRLGALFALLLSMPIFAEQGKSADDPGGQQMP
jgi:hypothetical protein